MRIILNNTKELAELLDSISVPHSKKCPYSDSPRNNCNCKNHELRKAIDLTKKLAEEEND